MKTVVVSMLAVAATSTPVVAQYGQPAKPAPAPPVPPVTPTAPPAAPGPAKPNVTAPPPVVVEPQPTLPDVDPKRLDRMPKDDRAALEELLGYAPPEFGENLKWLGTEATTWAKLRGKVVVLQSWSTGASSQRNLLERTATSLKDVPEADVQIIGLHTPENATNAEDFLKRQPPPKNMFVAIDAIGSYCDALGIYKHPANLVIDRNGMVRFVGLNLNGLKSAVAELTKEQADSKKIVQQRPKEKPAEVKAGEFPVSTNKVIGATDLRGKRGPELIWQQWYTQEPSLAGKVVMITFWSADVASTWGTHSLLNNFVNRFGNRLGCVALSEDSKSNFEDRMLREHLKRSDFDYAVGLDKARATANAMNLTAIPHTIVLSRDWIVRWQGSPGSLKADVLQKIIDADSATTTIPGSPGNSRKRGWTSGG